jgi:FkbM family methyltransferase
MINKITGTTDRTFKTVLDEFKKYGGDINVVYDIGANDGRWTKEFRHIIGSGTFILFEGNPKNTCKVTTLKNGESYNNILLSNVDDEIKKFYVPDVSGMDNTGASYYKELTPHYIKGEFIEVKSKKLDTFVEENDIPLPDVIKLDTQGSEVDILNGAIKCLSSAKILLTEIPISRYNENAPVFSDYISTLYDNGFLPTGVQHLAIRKGVFNQMDLVFMKKDIIQSIHNYKQKYTGF